MAADGTRVDDVDDAADLIDFYRDRPIQFYQDLGFDLADTQKEILRACQDHHRVLVWSGNGTGKTAGVMLAQYHYVMTRLNSVGLTTSGNYPTLKDTSWPFLQTIHQRAKEQYPIQAEAKQNAPRIEFPDDEFPEWWIKFRSPRDPRNLEGRHGRAAFVVIDEADKPDVGAGHFDAATSTASSTDDVCVAICNPPQDRGDVAFQKWDDPRWHVIEFDSFDSHNVKRDLGELPNDGDHDGIAGLVELDLIKEDYESWNGRPWPGVDDVRQAVTVEDGKRVARDDWRTLDPRWYRKRLGVMPPTGRGTLRPWYERHVDQAVEMYRVVTDDGATPSAAKGTVVQQMGGDVARDGGDRTVIVARWDTGLLDVVMKDRVNDHPENEDLFLATDDRLPRRGLFLIDAIGEGSGVADNVRQARDRVRRFKGSEVDSRDDDPREDVRYRNKRTEAAVDLGNALKDGRLLVPPNSSLERELRVAARVYRLDERSFRGQDVLVLKGKDDVKKPNNLGHSPDVADGAMMACYEGFEGDAEVIDPGAVVG